MVLKMALSPVNNPVLSLYINYAEGLYEKNPMLCLRTQIPTQDSTHVSSCLPV